MTKLLLTMTLAAALAGCAAAPVQLPPKIEVQQVDVPVAYVPAPPKFPLFESRVDRLTAHDAANPGKIGLAYKLDMIELRDRDRLFTSVLDAYSNAAEKKITPEQLETILKRPLKKD